MGVLEGFGRRGLGVNLEVLGEAGGGLGFASDNSGLVVLKSYPSLRGRPVLEG